MSGNILVVDDSPDMCEMIEADLKTRGYAVAWRTSAEDALGYLGTEDVDAVLTDLNMPGISGIELCRQIADSRPDIPVLVITAFGSMETAISAIRAGAYDFITKPIEMDLLSIALARAVKHRDLQKKINILSKSVAEFQRYDELVGNSHAMKTLYHQLERIGESDASVLIAGETGTGKELVARALHRQSLRNKGPFVAINCAALPETLMESELFGHAKGAFTDAKTARKGLFLEADGGTLFFDEIGDFPIALQPKLLRALEERKFRPVGSDNEVPFDARIIAATSRDLESAMEEKKFREDLYFRINVIQITLPPLSTRGTDILLLAQHFVEKYSALTGKAVDAISEGAAKKLLNYNWPGNIRELRNSIEHAVALTQHDNLVAEDLPEKIQSYARENLIIGNSDPGELISMEQLEKQYILHVLNSVDGNKTVAARILGFDRKTLYRKLERYKIE